MKHLMLLNLATLLVPIFGFSSTNRPTHDFCPDLEIENHDASSLLACSSRCSVMNCYNFCFSELRKKCSIYTQKSFRTAGGAENYDGIKSKCEENDKHIVSPETEKEYEEAMQGISIDVQAYLGPQRSLSNTQNWLLDPSNETLPWKLSTVSHLWYGGNLPVDTTLGCVYINKKLLVSCSCEKSFMSSFCQNYKPGNCESLPYQSDTSMKCFK